jgi:hypothetical protein
MYPISVADIDVIYGQFCRVNYLLNPQKGWSTWLEFHWRISHIPVTIFFFLQ